MRTVRQSSNQIGQWAEEVAYAYLCTQGLHCIERNYRCRVGEIDLIMQQTNILAFVEVRYRANQRYGGSLESIGRQKQRRIVATADYYLYSHPEVRQYYCRFDVVAISGGPQNPQVLWVTDAFRGE